MKLIGYTCTYNEAEMVPYVMPYVETLGYDKFIVYDNQSTDNTVELLSRYPFVEVRTYDTGGKFDDNKKRDLEYQAFAECKQIAAEAGGEKVWMTWTDFDEVLYFNADVGIDIIDMWNKTYGYNCFYKRMVNLFPPRIYKEGGLITQMHDGQLVHTVPDIRGAYWTGMGMKPLMFLVNDFDNIVMFPGNHYALAVMPENRSIIPFNDTCELYAFHLKFIDKTVLRKKWEHYAAKGKEVYVKQINKLDAMYENIMGTSFPMEQYFMADGFFSAGNRDGLYWDGLKNYNR